MKDRKLKKKIRIAYVGLEMLVVFLVCLSLVACDKEKKEQRERLVNVKIAAAETRKVQPYLKTTGTLKPDEEVTISSEVNGIVRTITVEEGSKIKKGTLLLTVNDIDYKLESRRSEAALRQAQANLDHVRAEFKRKNTLFQEELITRQQFDDISTRVALAKADFERAKAVLETSRQRLFRTKIYSPLTGAVKEKRISVGDYVGNGTPLLQLIKIDFLKLNFTISEKDAASIRVGQDVVFKVDSYEGKEFKGKVSLIYPHVEERTRTLQAEAVVSNRDGALKPGYFARVFIYTTAPVNAVLIPSIALIYDQDAVRVFVVDAGKKARERVVKLGGKYGEYVEITEGLEEKEQVVVVGQNNLSEGVKVNVAR